MQIHRLKSYKDLDFFGIHSYKTIIERFARDDSWDLHLANFALAELQILIPMKKFFCRVIYYSSKNHYLNTNHLCFLKIPNILVHHI